MNPIESESEASPPPPPSSSFFFNVVNFFDNKLGQRVELLAESAGEALELASHTALTQTPPLPSSALPLPKPVSPTLLLKKQHEASEAEFALKLQEQLDQTDANWTKVLRDSELKWAEAARASELKWQLEMETQQATFAKEQDQFKQQDELHNQTRLELEAKLKQELSVVVEQSLVLDHTIQQLNSELETMRQTQSTSVETANAEFAILDKARQSEVSELKQQLAKQRENDDTARLQSEQEFQLAMLAAREEINLLRDRQGDVERMELECQTFMSQARDEVEQFRLREQQLGEIHAAAVEQTRLEAKQLAETKLAGRVEKEKQAFELERKALEGRLGEALERVAHEHELKLSQQLKQYENKETELEKRFQRELELAKSQQAEETTVQAENLALKRIEKQRQRLGQVEERNAVLEASLLDSCKQNKLLEQQTAALCESMKQETDGLRLELDSANQLLDDAKKQLTVGRLAMEEQQQAVVELQGTVQTTTRELAHAHNQVEQYKQELQTVLGQQQRQETAEVWQLQIEALQALVNEVTQDAQVALGEVGAKDKQYVVLERELLWRQAQAMASDAIASALLEQATEEIQTLLLAAPPVEKSVNQHHHEDVAKLEQQVLELQSQALVNEAIVAAMLGQSGDAEALQSKVNSLLCEVDHLRNAGNEVVQRLERDLEEMHHKANASAEAASHAMLHLQRELSQQHFQPPPLDDYSEQLQLEVNHLAQELAGLEIQLQLTTTTTDNLQIEIDQAIAIKKAHWVQQMELELVELTETHLQAEREWVGEKQQLIEFYTLQQSQQEDVERGLESELALVKQHLEVEKEQVRLEVKAKAETVITKRVERERLRLEEEHRIEVNRVREETAAEVKAKAETVISKRVERERLRVEAEFEERIKNSLQEKQHLLEELARLRTQIESALLELKLYKQNNMLLKQEVDTQVQGERDLAIRRSEQVAFAIHSTRAQALNSLVCHLDEKRLRDAFQTWRRKRREDL
ncbi:hypothetical protein BASA81_015071 [Batrachochytrium salamandrivorans]|nr:hypothetical protein BASA81_015071 [Batrachochytrium salamandrivorans]